MDNVKIDGLKQKKDMWKQELSGRRKKYKEKAIGPARIRKAQISLSHKLHGNGGR